MSLVTGTFETDLYSHIPIARQMGVRAREISSEAVLLEAPLAPNSNHNSTGFGGSVYAVAVLSCWALISETVRAAGLKFGYIVIQDAEISYDFPVNGDFLAESRWPTPKDRDLFLARLQKKGVARARLIAQVTIDASGAAMPTSKSVPKPMAGLVVTGSQPPAHTVESRTPSSPPVSSRSCRATASE